ncbi:hypothetical protein WG66_014819, partial [Moniliophthora roreri]
MNAWKLKKKKNTWPTLTRFQQHDLFNPHHSVSFYPIQQGLPLKGDEKGMLPRCVHPFLRIHRISSREPIDPGKPLPYTSPLYGTTARCPTIKLKEEPPEPIQMTMREAVRLSLLLNKDSGSRDRRTNELRPSMSQE